MKNKLVTIFSMLILLGGCDDAPELKTQDLFRIYPNPCVHRVNFYLNNKDNMPTSVSLIGARGNKIYEATLSSNDKSIEIDLTSEESGQLYFEVLHNGKFYREKLIKLE